MRLLKDGWAIGLGLVRLKYEFASHRLVKKNSRNWGETLFARIGTGSSPRVLEA